MKKEKEIFLRIRRIKGQISGIEKMLTEKRSCLEIIQQIKAVREALGKLAKILLTQQICLCEEKKKPKEFEKIIEELFKNM